MESSVIQAILPDGANPLISRGGIDVLYVNHHGSESSTNANLMNGAQPAVAVIATGAGQAKNWNLPRKDVVRKVLRAKAKCVTAPPALVLQTEEGHPRGGRTARQGYCVGNITIVTDGTTYTVDADGDVTQGPNELNKAQLRRTFDADGP